MQRAHGAKNLRKEVPPILLGKVLTAETERLTWRSRRKQADWFRYAFPFDVVNIYFFDGTLKGGSLRSNVAP